MMSASRLASLFLFGVAIIGGCHTFTASCPYEEPNCSDCQPACRTWEGIYPTVLTPWTCEGSVDEPALAAQIRYQLRGGVNGLLVLGTIGEGETASMEERAKVISVAVATASGTIPVVAGIHTCDLNEARAQIFQAKEHGASAVLVKYWGNPKACHEEILGFYQSLGAMETLPIFFYYYPSETGVKLTPDQVAEILLLPGIVGIKESTLDLKETRRHVELTYGHDKIFLSGTALNLTQFLAVGGHGAMCPEAALLPKTTVRAYSIYTHGNPEIARTVQKELFVLAPLLRKGFSTENSTKQMTMTAQDHHVKLPMGNDHPQARLKTALDGLGIQTSAAVKPPLPGLTFLDGLKVHQAVNKIRRVEAVNDEIVLDAVGIPPQPPPLHTKQGGLTNKP